MKLLKTLLIVLGIYFVIDKAKNFINAAHIAESKQQKNLSQEERKANTMAKVNWGPQAEGVGGTYSGPMGYSLPPQQGFTVKLSDAEMFRQNVFQLDEIYHCMYDDRTGTWRMKPETGWSMEGHYDLKGETKGKVRDVSIKYYQQYNAELNSACTVNPEWGNSYIDEDCKKKYIETFKEDLYNIVYKRRFEGKNIYKICANTCGGGIGHCK